MCRIANLPATATTTCQAVPKPNKSQIAIYAGMFDTPEQRRSEGNRGKIPITHELTERPDWEADTILQAQIGFVGRQESWCGSVNRGKEFQLHDNVTACSASLITVRENV